MGTVVGIGDGTGVVGVAVEGVGVGYAVGRRDGTGVGTWCMYLSIGA